MSGDKQVALFSAGLVEAADVCAAGGVLGTLPMARSREQGQEGQCRVGLKDHKRKGPEMGQVKWPPT